MNAYSSKFLTNTDDRMIESIRNTEPHAAPHCCRCHHPDDAVTTPRKIKSTKGPDKLERDREIRRTRGPPGCCLPLAQHKRPDTEKRPAP
jgi:hypothetical protein